MPTLSDLQSTGATVRFICQECGATGDADLPAMIAAKGPDFDLTDKLAPCKAPGCTYWVGFYAQQGQVTRSLSTRAGDMAESEMRTVWLRSRHSKTPPA